MARKPLRVVGVFSTATGELSIFRFLAEQEGIELVVLFTHEDRSGRGGAGEAGFSHRMLRSRLIWRNRQTAVDQVWNPGLTRTIRDLRPEVILLGGYGSLSFVRTIAWAGRAGVPWVLYSESWGIGRGAAWKRRLKGFVLPRILGRASGFVTYGRIGEEYLRHYGARGPVAVIGSNRDLRSIAAAADAARSRRRSDGERAFVFVGRLVETKGVDVLIRAFRGVSPELPGWRLLVAGEGPLRELVHTSSRDLPVEPLGSVPFPRIAELLARGDVLVLPSRHEPWGQVVPEAMAAGLAVIASDAVGAASHFIEPGRTGWVVPSGNAHALASAMKAAAEWETHAIRATVRDRALRDDVREAASRIRDLLVRVEEGVT